MTPIGWETLVAALRAEAQEYGGLLGLFEEQQEAILHRQPDVVLAVNESIEAQTKTIRSARKQREEVARDFAVSLQQHEEIKLRDMVGFFAEPARPLLMALIDEINHLVSRARRRAKQNQMLLARSIEVSQQILQRLNPEAVSKTYSARGRMQIAPAGVKSRRLADC